MVAMQIFYFLLCKGYKLNEITQLSSSKAGQSTDIPPKIIQQNSDIFADFIFTSFNQAVANSIFPSSLKHADITPVFKKGDRNLRDNYRPVSILSNISKIFERCINKFQNLWSHCSQNTIVGLERVITLSTVS